MARSILLLLNRPNFSLVTFMEQVTPAVCLRSGPENFPVVTGIGSRLGIARVEILARTRLHVTFPAVVGGCRGWAAETGCLHQATRAELF